MIINTHECEEMQLDLNEKSKLDTNGHAVDLIVFDGLNWVATQKHLEYSTVIHFCPFCGKEL